MSNQFEEIYILNFHSTKPKKKCRCDIATILYFINVTTLAQLVVIPTITESSQGRVPDTKLTSIF